MERLSDDELESAVTAFDRLRKEREKLGDTRIPNLTLIAARQLQRAALEIKEMRAAPNQDDRDAIDRICGFLEMHCVHEHDHADVATLRRLTRTAK